MTPHQVLQDYFGYNNFRPGQSEIINDILQGKNVLAVMPTGAGKSLCYQIPAIIKERFSIVISPLISLMQDQVESINKTKKIAAFINSSLDYSGTQKVLSDIANNKIKLLYIAPEKLNNSEFVKTIKNLKPYYLFVDEAHCISEWGHNFRPSYRNIKIFAEKINAKNIAAFTATATPEVREDIIEQLQFVNSKIFVYGFERNNISLSVRQVKSKDQDIINLVKKNNTPTIIYTSTRKNCEKLAHKLKQNNIQAEHYHAGLSNELRTVIQNDFIENNLQVIVATNAFGMGIDKKDIGMVIHYNIPGSLENLYQEFGRAGRDGREVDCITFFNHKDKYTQEYLIALNNPTLDEVKRVYNTVLDYHKISVNSFTEKQLELNSDLLKLIEKNGIHNGKLNAIFTILEISNYLKFISSINVYDNFHFLISQEKLKSYIKNVKTIRLKNFLIILLQYYGSIPFQRSVKVNYKELGNLLNVPKNSLTENFERLNKAGILDYETRNSSNYFDMLQERVPVEKLRIDELELQKKYDYVVNKLNSVIEYCLTDECRFKFILDYFGEDTRNYKCGKCDNCKEKNEDNAAKNEYLKEILSKTLKEFQGGLTPNRLVGILTGKSKSKIAKSISTYQSCMHYSTSEIENAISHAVNSGLLKEVGGKLFVDLVEDLEIITANSLEENDYEQNLELFNRLRTERKNISRKYQQSPEIVCADNILKIIAREKPKTPSELMAINGFNQRMFNKVGLEFIETVKEFLSETKNSVLKTDLPKHIIQTYQLIKKGYSLEEISNLLKLPESIVSIQIETIVKYYPKLNYDNLITEEVRKLIEDSVVDSNEDLKEIKKKLPTNISYAKIRVVKAIISK